MFVRIRNTPLDYAWGTDGEITRLLGATEACAPRTDGGPEAELWLGAHDGSPSRIIDGEAADGAEDLRAWIAADPARTLGCLADGLRDGDGPRLPFLVKVLAAGAPLSLQAHPSLEHAREGFARENELGLPVDAPIRSYRDPSHKPELLLALSETMEALAGFRPTSDVVAVLDGLHAAAPEDGARSALTGLRNRVAAVENEAGRRELVAWLLGRGADAMAATEAVIASAHAVGGGDGDGDGDDSDRDGDGCRDGDRAEGHEEREPTAATSLLARDAATVRLLAERYPGDPGVVIALLLHRLTLRRGEALFVAAGSLHAYLRGVGLEVMASSDNVLRGGLTPKHVDVPELLHILDAAEVAPPYLEPSDLGGGVAEYRPSAPDFRLTRVTLAAGEPAAAVSVHGPAILLCLSGEPRVQGSNDEMRMRTGVAAYVTPDEGSLSVAGPCDLLVATVGIDGCEDVPIRG